MLGMFDVAGLAAETQVLLCCARTVLTPVLRARLAALRAWPIDWNVVLEEAGRHRLLPLLHHHASVLPLPEWAAYRLEREFAAVARRGLTLANELIDIADALRAASIGITPFRGPALGAAAYGRVLLRQFDNLDILVRRADVAAAERTLSGRGYRPAPGLAGDARSARTWMRDDVMLTLHCALAPDARGGVAGLWMRRRHVDLGDAGVLAPSPEDHLLLVTLHAARRGWGRIGTLADVAGLLDRHPGMDHVAIRQQARRHGSERLLRWGLGLAQSLLDAPLPHELAAWVRRGRRLDDLHLRSRERWSCPGRHAAQGAGGVLTMPVGAVSPALPR